MKITRIVSERLYRNSFFLKLKVNIQIMRVCNRCVEEQLLPPSRIAINGGNVILVSKYSEECAEKKSMNTSMKLQSVAASTSPRDPAETLWLRCSIMALASGHVLLPRRILQSTLYLFAFVPNYIVFGCCLHVFPKPILFRRYVHTPVPDERTPTFFYANHGGDPSESYL